MKPLHEPAATAVTIRAGDAVLHGDLVIPPSPGGLVIFAHGSGSSRFSARNRSVAQVLQHAGFATAEAYRSHPDWNVAIGQGFDWHRRSGTPGEQIARWAEIGRARQGVVFWVWRWPGQEGIGDNPEARAAYHKAGGL